MRLTGDFFIIRKTNNTENGFSVDLCTNPEHLIYRVHFPEKPITPGVCIIQAAGELLECKLNKKINLKSIKNVKFLSVIIPEKEKRIKYTFSNIVEEENGCKAYVVVSDETTVYAKISLIYSYVRL